MTFSDIFQYEKTEGGYILESYLQNKNPEITEIDIPSEYLGKPVLKIGEYAFAYALYLEKVHIPDSVTTICAHAFESVYLLESVDLPSTLIEIGASAFEICGSLNRVDLPEGLKYIGANAFDSIGDHFDRIVFPKSLEAIGDFAFAECHALKTAVFTNPHTKLGKYIFADCKSLAAENILMSLISFVDITAPPEPFYEIFFSGDFFREDVFELAVKNNYFRNTSRGQALDIMKFIIKFKYSKLLLPMAERGGLLSDGELVEECIGYSAENGETEITAWLLDLKNRKFGFTADNEGTYDL